MSAKGINQPNAGMAESGEYSPCVKVTVDNCEVFESFEKCKICKKNFAVASNGTCKLKPKQAPESKMPDKSSGLTGLQYKSMVKCLECKNKFYSAFDKKSCVPVTEVENCTEYDNMWNRCRKCQKEYALSLDQKSCMKIPANCKKFDKYDDKIHCYTCDDYFYSVKGKCIKGTIPNCRVYDEKANICVECDEQFSIDCSGKCTRFSLEANPDCVSINQKTSQCTKCKNNKFVVRNYERCKKIPSESMGCAAFDEKGGCSECKDYYYGTSCQFKAKYNYKNCLKFANNSDDLYLSHCLACKNNSYFLYKNKCQFIKSKLYANFYRPLTTDKSYDACEKSSIFSDFKRLTQNVPLSSFETELKIPANCNIFDIQSNRCQLCNHSYFLDNDYNCVRTCKKIKSKSIRIK